MIWLPNNHIYLFYSLIVSLFLSDFTKYEWQWEQIEDERLKNLEKLEEEAKNAKKEEDKFWA
jgi:hypothetical protein